MSGACEKKKSGPLVRSFSFGNVEVFDMFGEVE